MKKKLLFVLLMMGFVGLAGVIPSKVAAAFWVEEGWSNAYVIDEFLGDDIVVEWTLPSTVQYRINGRNSDAQQVLDNGALVTREVINGEGIVRLTAGSGARSGTQYGGLNVTGGDAQRLANDLKFEFFVR